MWILPLWPAYQRVPGCQSSTSFSQTEHHNYWNQYFNEKLKELLPGLSRKLKKSKSKDWWIPNQKKTFTVSTGARSLMTRDTSCNQMKQITHSSERWNRSQIIVCSTSRHSATWWSNNVWGKRWGSVWNPRIDPDCWWHFHRHQSGQCCSALCESLNPISAFRTSYEVCGKVNSVQVVCCYRMLNTNFLRKFQLWHILKEVEFWGGIILVSLTFLWDC